MKPSSVLSVLKEKHFNIFCVPLVPYLSENILITPWFFHNMVQYTANDYLSFYFMEFMKNVSRGLKNPNIRKFEAHFCRVPANYR